jgi:xylulokinase
MDETRSIAKLNYFDALRDSGTMQAGGYSYAWLRGALCQAEENRARQTGQDPFVLINALAEQSPVGANGVLFLPYLLGERAPYWDPKMRGGFLGLGPRVERADLCRSVLEGISLHIGVILDVILRVNCFSRGDISCMKIVGGGAKSPLWRQIFADVLDLPISSLTQPGYAGVLGGAVICGVGLGLFKDIGVIDQFQKVASVTQPNKKHTEVYRRLTDILIGANAALSETNHRLFDLYAQNIT